MSHMIGMSLAYTTIRRAGFVPRMSEDGQRLEMWRGVRAGSVSVAWEDTVPLVSRHGLARALYGA